MNFFVFLNRILFCVVATFLFSWCAERQIIPVPSKVMGKKFKAAVILPSVYPLNKDRFPVIYLLHGFGGNHTSWLGIISLDNYADSLRVIFVCPFGDNSWYIDSPFMKNSLFETYIIKEVIPFIDSLFRTQPYAVSRAIMGMSMGGHGALYLMARNPGIFAGACSIAGIMNLSEFPFEWNLPKILGPLKDNRVLWHANSCTGMTTLFKERKEFVILDCGTSDFAFRGNLIQDSLLNTTGISHFFYSGKGSHDRNYASRTAPSHLKSIRSRLVPLE